MKISNALALALIAMAACTKSTPPPPPVPKVACIDATPCALDGKGTPLSGTIAAAGQVDVYTVEVPASRAGLRTIVQVQVNDDAPVTPVKLVYLLESPDGNTVLARRGPKSGNGAQLLTGNFLINTPGIYRVLVRDVLTQAADTHNGYSIQAVLLDDPDASFEPDNTLDKARPLALSAAGTSLSGSVTFAGDRDLATFTVPPPGTIVRLTASQAAVADSPLRLRVRLLALAGADLSSASSVLDLIASAAGAGLTADRTRFLAPGKYVIAVEDATADGADVRPQARWTVAIQPLPDPDPNEQGGMRNDTPATATSLPATGAPLQGAIGSQGDRDWYRVDLPASSTMKVLELRVDPKLANDDLELNWTVAEQILQPSAACDHACGPSFLCSPDNHCAFDMHAQHHFAHGETTPQVVRIRHIGLASAVYIAVNDQGDLRFSSQLYAVSARLMDDADPNELDGGNDTLDTATPLQGVDAGTLTRYSTQGQITSWDFIDGLTPFEQRSDVDWYSLPLPPRDLGPPDGGCPDAGLADGGCAPVPQPRPNYGIALHWRGPADGVYRLGLQGVVLAPDGGGSTCLFSLDERYAHAEGADGGYSIGTDPGDPCFCLASANAEGDRLWMRIEAPTRPKLPAPNVYSDLPYSVALELTPRTLPSKCDGGCAPLRESRSCPGQ